MATVHGIRPVAVITAETRVPRACAHFIQNWLPVFLFVILFGLSMDYHVFILTRVRELYDRGMSTDEAVREGISQTAGTVTSAAAVMIGVFSVFATLSFLDFKEMGVGLAVAVLIAPSRSRPAPESPGPESK